ncbi:MAG: C-GCAxxG-C-C family protein, partial [Candidatus Lokiarchaeia archaeon]|nr:C-GCAxxG-C-C family protein [Candidatus Lokiarchaeia archaeon]
NFRDDFNCAQSVLSTFSSQLGLSLDTALKLASGFGGGMGRLGNTCGAVTGAFMVIGLKYGMGINRNIEAKEKTYQLIREFSEKFQEIHGSLICKQLLGCDLNTPDGKDYFNQNNLFEKKCLQYVKNAVEILEEII